MTKPNPLEEALARGEVPRLRDVDPQSLSPSSRSTGAGSSLPTSSSAGESPVSTDGVSGGPASRRTESPETNGSNGRLLESLNGAYTLRSFIVGPGSRVAHAAVVAVSEHPGRTYNPLCIWGAPGVGKSHLLQGLARRLAQTSNLRIRYTSGESFTNRYISATQSHDLDAFLEHYNNIDVLVFDDLQFLSEKRRTQEALLEILSTLLADERQLVFSSDRKPLDIRGFSSRLLSKFRGGLETMIEAPSFETRVAIAVAKAKELQFELPTLVAEYLAQQVTASVRELEGALACLVNVAHVHRSPLSLDMARLALNEFLPSAGEGPAKAVSAGDIIESVIEFYKVPRRDVMSPLKVRTVVRARQVAMYLTRELTPLSLAQIGSQFGGRDHTTVLYALRCVNRALSREPELSADLDVLRSRLSSR